MCVTASVGETHKGLSSLHLLPASVVCGLKTRPQEVLHQVIMSDVHTGIWRVETWGLCLEH